MNEQTALTSPTRRVHVARLTDRQRDLLTIARAAPSRPLTPALLRSWGFPLADASGALCRLERRGLLRRVARGRYRPVVVGERRRRLPEEQH